MFGGLVGLIIFSTKFDMGDNKKYKLFKIGCVIWFVGSLLLAFLSLSIVYEWDQAVKDQVESLECEEYEEAYELYKKEFIKTEYQKRCVDTRNDWWSDLK